MRIYKWQYEYTRELVLNMPVKQLKKLIDETQFQEHLHDYHAAANSAMIAVTLANLNSKNRRYQVSDFIGLPPVKRKVKRDVVIELVKEMGLEIPN